MKFSPGNRPSRRNSREGPSAARGTTVEGRPHRRPLVTRTPGRRGRHRRAGGRGAGVGHLACWGGSPAMPAGPAAAGRVSPRSSAAAPGSPPTRSRSARPAAPGFSPGQHVQGDAPGAVPGDEAGQPVPAGHHDQEPGAARHQRAHLVRVARLSSTTRPVYGEQAAVQPAGCPAPAGSAPAGPRAREKPRTASAGAIGSPGCSRAG